jgi:integrase
MAKQPFRHGEYRLSWLKGEACAVKGAGDSRNRFRLGVYTEEEGRAALVAFVISQERGEAIAAGTVGALWKAYRDDREKDGKVMRAFDTPWLRLAPFFASLPIYEVNKDVCRTYAKTRFETGKGRRGKRVSNDTVWTELNKLASCLNWAVDEAKLIAKAPAVWLPSRTKKAEEVLTPDEVLRLLDSFSFECTPNSQGTRHQDNRHLRLFTILAMCTAGRPTAILELTWPRVDFNRRLINLKTGGNDDPMSKAYKKGRAIVHMNDLALTALMEARACAETGYVIEYQGAKVLRISKGFRAAVIRAGLPDWVSPHKLRHATATWVDEAGINPEFTSELLGHKPGSRVTEDVYIHRKGSRTKEATGVVDTLLGGKRMRAVK